MSEDTKAAKNQRRAEALRANLKRRKSAARAASTEGTSDSGASRKPAEAHATAGDGGMD